jgi:hypothetical protein
LSSPKTCTRAPKTAALPVSNMLPSTG